MRRTLIAAVVAVLSCAAWPAPAPAAACPSFDGGMQFPQIHSPADPEDYCWEVQLGEEQELRQVDEQHAAVYYGDPVEHIAFTITAEEAHDADGSSVPTTLAVSERNIITLTVHHREGNPAAGGAPFVYPITEGAGWEGGFETVQIQGPPDEAELREAALRAARDHAALEAAAPTCLVPNLVGRSLRSSRKVLEARNCLLGPVRGRRSKSLRVVRQYRPTGEALPAGTKVGVKLGA
jgi:hypothetical protein